MLSFRELSEPEARFPRTLALGNLVNRGGLLPTLGVGP
jgi:hypothetical protein